MPFYDPQKVLIIVNASPTIPGDVDPGEKWVDGTDNFSIDMANYLIAARGLNSDHIYPLNLGTARRWTDGTGGVSDFLNEVIKPLATYISTNGIQVVLVSAGCPCEIATQGVLVGFDALVAAAPLYDTNDRLDITYQGWEIPRNYVGAQALGVKYFETHDGKRATLYDHAFQHWATDWVNAVLPYGRIGVPRRNNDVALENSITTQRCIDDAVASETDYASAIAAGHLYQFGHNEYAPPDITGYANELGALEFERAGLTVERFKGGYYNEWPIQPSFDYQKADIIDGNFAPPKKLNGWIGSALTNEPIQNPWIGSYDVQRGAWAYEATSTANVPITIVENGGCAGIGAIREPYSSYISNLRSIAITILQGNPMCLVAAQSMNVWGWMSTAFGDPLYAPFGKDNNARNYYTGHGGPTGDMKFTMAPSALNLTGTEILGCTQNGEDRNMTINDLLAYIRTGA